MAVSLKKGQGVSLKKTENRENDLSRVTIGLGWDVAQPSGGGLLGLFKKPEEEYDLDVVAFLLGENGKVNNLGRIDGQRGPVDGDVIFFNSLKHSSGQIWLTGDNRTGAGDGDDEQIIVNLNYLPPEYQKIVFVVQIYQGQQRKQSFGRIKNAFIRAVDRKDREMVRFDLSGTGSYANACSLIFAELTRQGTDWTFTAVGEPFPTDSFGHILKARYLP